MAEDGPDTTISAPKRHVEELERRLHEAEETIEAIRTGAVDAIVVSGEKGEHQVFTLEGADSPYRAIIETMSEGAVTLNSDGVILYCNKRFSEILDIPIERLIGTGFSTHCIDGHALSRILRAAMTGAGKGEVHLKTGSGSPVPVYISGNGHGSLGTAASSCLMVTDISELTEARDALQKSHDGLERRVEERTAELVRANAALKEEIEKARQAEEELRGSRRELEVRVRERTTEVRRAFEKLSKERRHLYDVLETMHVMVCLIRADYRVAFANRAFRERFGEDRGRRCFEYVFDKSAPCEFCQSFNVFETGAAHEWELECPDGTVLAVYDYPFNDIDGSPLILEMDLDITEQRRAEKALRLANAYNRSLIEASLDLLVTIDPEGCISDANIAAEQVTGWSREELIGKDFSDCFTDPQRARMGYLQVFKEGSVRDYQLHICHRDGHTVPVLYNASVYRNENGQVAGVFAAARDISERQKLEGELRQAHKMEAVGTLAGGIAHDFNNMLAVILGNAELALDDIEDEALRASIGQIVKASKRSRDLVKQVLTFSRRSGREPKAVPVVPLLKETHELLRAALPSTISMVLNIRTKSDTVIFGDASEVQQIVVNLANNAAYAMRESGGSLTIGLSSVAVGEGTFKNGNMRPGRYLKLTVRDTGTGMTPEVQSRMFDPFFTTKAQGEGTGMGLSVVYGIVRGHNGMVEAESRTGKGTLFTVLLPQWDLSCTAFDEKEKSLPGLGGERVLFVDDEPAVVEMAEAMLTRLGCRVIAATDAYAAMKAFGANPQAYDVVITDQTMPGMNGVELAKKILSVREDTPIILCTGYSETVSPERAREVGIREFVMKPITRDEMAQAIRRALEQEGPAQ